MRFTKNIIALALACSLGLGIACANGSFTTSQLRELVESGNTKYLPAYAQRLITGNGTEVDATKSLELYKQAAMLGNPEGKYGLAFGFMYGVKELDLFKAFELLQAASNGGVTMAASDLGTFYDIGLGTKSNYAKALEQYTKAAPRDFAAKCARVDMYGKRTPFYNIRIVGQCTNDVLESLRSMDTPPKMFPQVYDFLLQGREQMAPVIADKLKLPRKPIGEMSAMEQYNWGMVYQLAMEMGIDAADLDKKRCEYLQVAAQRQFIPAQVALVAWDAENGDEASLQKLIALADNGQWLAKMALLDFYYYRAGLDKNIAQRYVSFLKEMAEIGFNPAYEQIADFYLAQGNKEAAWDATLKAADAGNARSCFKVAEFYRTGNCEMNSIRVSPNPKKAYEYMSQLCEDLPYGDYTEIDMCHAFTVFGNMYYFGNGVAKDVSKAQDWYQSATQMNRGDKTEANYRLGTILAASPGTRVLGLEMLRQVAEGPKSGFSAQAQKVLRGFRK